MNLDYRKGSINFTDLNSTHSYDPTAAFNQSQLANILAVKSLANDWLPDKITVNAVDTQHFSNPLKALIRCTLEYVQPISSVIWVLTRVCLEVW